MKRLLTPLAVAAVMLSPRPATRTVGGPIPPGKDPEAPLTGTQLEVMTVPALTHEFLDAAAYATRVETARGSEIDGTPMTQYTLSIDPVKAAAGKAFGGLLSPEMLAEQKAKVITAVLVVRDDFLPRRLDFVVGNSTMSTVYSNFGDPVTLVPPAKNKIDG
ncbi:hypothetical protein AB0P21_03270 [Kribbella sp. NPDC056861]|uniref:hypothetical protein n=1 Tax=Kribbella sp. NPDC056861 TaxID=3154857 RepID=UPI0034212BA3